MLKPREANMPEMWASTPGWFCTRADRTCRIIGLLSRTGRDRGNLRERGRRGSILRPTLVSVQETMGFRQP